MLAVSKHHIMKSTQLKRKYAYIAINVAET